MNNQANNSRRKFIKTTGAVAGITVLPSTSVWGACNASGISGGSKVINVTCSVPEITGGWSPGTWKKLTKSSACSSHWKAKKKIKKIFGSHHSSSTLNSYVKGMAHFLSTTQVTFGDGSTVEQISFNIAEVFDKDDTGDSKMDLAAMYLNIYFGLADWDKILNSSAELLAEDFWGSMCVEHGLENKMSSPRWSKPLDSALSTEIGNQYWSDSSSGIASGDTSKIPVGITSLNC
ncbi:hypothetical protein ACE41O_06990 [Alteromonas macleodii]|uniref:hypothetical protein n=1 Tax=Alteromonas TaxID=226 RepID=UPI0025810529|nr:hypothetical protein [Alteromonas sp. AO-Serp]